MKNKEKIKVYNKIYWKRAKADPIKSERIRASSRKAVRKYYQNNKDKISEYQKKRKLRIRFEILDRYGFTCQYCGRKAPEVVLQIDHILATAKGGKNEKDNLIVACYECNQGKGDLVLNSVVSSRQ